MKIQPVANRKLKFLYILLNSKHVVEKCYHLLIKTEIPWKKLIPDSTNLVLFFFIMESFFPGYFYFIMESFFPGYFCYIMESFFSRVFLLHNGIVFFRVHDLTIFWPQAFMLNEPLKIPWKNLIPL